MKNIYFALFHSIRFFSSFFLPSRLIILGIISTFLSGSFSLAAQSAPHPSFYQYTTKDGLASSEVYQILQDKNGFMWMATDNGLSRFDGYDFRNYGVKEGLKENVIFAMQLDKSNRLWMQALSGNLYYMEGDSILPYWNNDVLLTYKNRITARGFIVEGSGETVHITTFKYGVLTIANNGQITSYPTSEVNSRQVFFHTDSLLNNGGQLINASVENEALQLSTSTDKKPSIYFYIDGKESAFLELTLLQKGGQAPEAFYLGTEKYFYKNGDTIWFIEKGEIKWRHHFPYNILFVQLMKNGQLFIGLHFQQGLKVFDSIEAFQKDDGHTWLPEQSVSNFTIDREGGWWFATNENGIFYAPMNGIRVHDKETGLPNEKITALTIKNENELFVGLANGEVWSLERTSGTWKQLPPIPSIGFIKHLFFDQLHQQLWVGCGSLFYLEKNKWIKSKTPFQKRELSLGNYISASPKNERLWVANHFGLMSIELPKKVSSNILVGYDQRTFVVKEDFSGNVWVGNPNGLFQLKDGALLAHQSYHPALSLRVEDIALMPDSTIVIATKGGGLVFMKNGIFEQISTTQGLTADMLECVYADKKGVVWAGTLNGLNRITGTSGNRKVEQITTFHGLPSNEINEVSSFGNNVWIATSKGLVRFSKRNKNQFSQEPILTKVLANNHLVDLSKPMNLSHAENNLTISFFAINYKMTGKIIYRYRMENGEWITTTNRSVNFPALPFGQRYFELQAQNEDGIWSKTKRLQIIIHPPWWQTWWAITLMILSVLGIGVSAYLIRTKQLKNSHEIQIQMTNLERSALQAQMNPHFIFNCLNSIQNYILKNEKEAAILYLTSFSSLVRSMLKASVVGKIFLDEEIKLLNNYLELEKMRMKSRFQYEVKTKDGLDIFDIKIPPLLVQPFVENAVKHGVSGRKNGGLIKVFFEEKEHYLEVTISDNGVGLKSLKEQLGKDKLHESFGMSITSNRLELLSNKKDENSVSTKNLLDKNGKIDGTEVTIRINISEEIRNE